MKKTNHSDSDLKSRALRLGLCGLVTHWDEVSEQPWVEQLVAYEESERTKRSLERRIHLARLGRFKSVADFEWNFPKKIDKPAIEELFKLTLFEEGSNAVLVGPNGVGKTMLLKNLSYQALMKGYKVRFVTASAMLNELAAQESTTSLNRRLRQYFSPQLLCVDEVGYLSYDSRYADLLFEVITRRYEAMRPIVLTTNKPFSEWTEVFPHAACVVTLVDRLIHRCEVIAIEGDSYRRKEAQDRATLRKKARPQTTK